jgi:hypothetical protein
MLAQSVEHLTKGQDVTGSTPVYVSSLQGLTSEAEISKRTAQDFNAQIATLKAASKAIVMLTAAEMQTGLPLLSAGSRADGCYSEGTLSPKFIRSTGHAHVPFTHGTVEERMEQLRRHVGKRQAEQRRPLYGTHAMEGFKR